MQVLAPHAVMAVTQLEEVLAWFCFVVIRQVLFVLQLVWPVREGALKIYSVFVTGGGGGWIFVTAS